VIETALLIAVAESPASLHRIRARYDPSADRGVPEHLTLLYPFLPPDAVDDGVAERLRLLFAGFEPFRFALTRTGWFGTDILWLAPEPAAPFVQLTQAIWDEFATPPYGGMFDEITPHLTVAQGAHPALLLVEREVGGLLPVQSQATQVSLLAGGEPGWRELMSFSLGTGRRP
jgi:2'-5' RNA ligase